MFQFLGWKLLESFHLYSEEFIKSPHKTIVCPIITRPTQRGALRVHRSTKIPVRIRKSKSPPPGLPTDFGGGGATQLEGVGRGGWSGQPPPTPSIRRRSPDPLPPSPSCRSQQPLLPICLYRRPPESQSSPHADSSPSSAPPSPDPTSSSFSSPPSPPCVTPHLRRNVLLILGQRQRST